MQALPLLLWPSLVTTLLQPSSSLTSPEGCYISESHSHEFETYYARLFGLALLCIGLTQLVLSGFLHFSSSESDYVTIAHDLVEKNGRQQKPVINPYAESSVLISTLYHGASAFYLYTRILRHGSSAGYVLGCAGSTTLFCLGLWVYLFAGDKGHMSRRTGADKRTSGFPFGNTEADKKKSKSKKF